MDYILTFFKKMLGHPKKADRNLKRIKWTLGNLGIYKSRFYKMNDGRPQKIEPFPPNPLPNSIVGFSSVAIFSSDAIAFLQCIGRLLESDICLQLYIDWEKDWNTFATSVWPLFNVSAIIKIHVQYPSAFRHFRLFISPSFLRDCSNLRMISLDDDQILQFPPNDSKGSSDGQALCKWLHTPRADGQPKVIKSYLRGGIFQEDALKTTFLNATTSVSFIIHLYSFTSDVVPFELVNLLTREQLSFRKMGNAVDDGGWWLIERSQIDKNAAQWAKWKHEALDDWTKSDWKMLRMYHLGIDL